MARQAASLSHARHDGIMELSCWSGIVSVPTLAVKFIKKMSKPVA